MAIKLPATAFNTSDTKQVLINGVPVIIVTNTKLSKSKDVKDIYGFGQKEPYGKVTGQKKQSVSIDVLMVQQGYSLDFDLLEDFEVQLLDTNGPSYMCTGCEWTAIDETSQVNETTARNISIEIGDVVPA